MRPATTVALMLLLLAGRLFGAHQDAPIVHLAQPPVIDGGFDDWPFPAVLAMRGADGSATFRLGYDADNLYLAIAVVDASPFRNRASVPQEALAGGDAVALYLQARKGDEQRILFAPGDGAVAVYAHRPHGGGKGAKPWTFTSPAGEAAFADVAPLAGVTTATRIAAGGYQLEAAMPWKSLGLKPRPDATFAFDASVLFSDPAGMTCSGSIWWWATTGPGLTIEDLPTEAQLYPETWGMAQFTETVWTPAVQRGGPTSGNGGASIPLHLPRAGKLSLQITDDSGWILRELVCAAQVPAGDMDVAWDGRDRYGEALPPGGYHYRALLFDGMYAEFMGSVGSSGRPPYRTDDGLGAIGGQHGSWKTVAADAGGVYMGGGGEEGQPALRKIDPATGVALWKRSVGGFGIACGIACDGAEVVVLQKRAKSYTLVRIDGATGRNREDLGKAAVINLAVPEPDAATGGLALAGGAACISLPSLDRIRVVRLADGTAQPDIAIPAPQGLVRRDATSLLVCSGGDVLVVDLAAGGRTRPLITGLDQPRTLTITGDGTILVAEGGAKQCISRFGPDGAARGSWGRPGGRPTDQRPYDPLAFRNIVGLCVDAQGGIWAGENDPVPNRFIALRADGSWREDFYGPVAYNAFGPDLDDRSTVYYIGNPGRGQVIETHVDYAAYARDPSAPQRAWTVRAIHDLGLGADGVTRNEPMSEIISTGYGHLFAFTADNGHRYLFRPSKHNRARAPIGAGLWIGRGGRWIPCAMLLRGDQETPIAWSDRNGDGLIQDDETAPWKTVKEVAWIGRDLALQGFEGRVAPDAIDAQGVPSYRDAVLRPYLDPAALATGGGWTFGSQAVDDGVYYIANMRADRHLSFWDRASENRLIKVAGGRIQWFVGEHDPKGIDYRLSTCSGIAGIADGIVLVQNIEPCTYPAFTTDGFALGNVLLDQQGRRSSAVGINIESFTGLFVKDAASGDRMLYAVSSGDDRIVRIVGPGRCDRLQGDVRLVSSSRYGATDAPLQVPYAQHYGNNLRGMGVDGDDDDWAPAIPPCSLVAPDGQVVGDLRLRRMAGDLLLFASFTGKPQGAVLELTLKGPSGATCGVHIEPGVDAGKPTIRLGGAADAAAAVRVARTTRWRDLGLRLEASIPMQALAGLTAPAKQLVRERVKKEVETTTRTLPDLVDGTTIEAALLLPGASGQVRCRLAASGQVELAR